jgi:hypothetical protein
MIGCDDCSAWVHLECDEVPSVKGRYSCPTCRLSRESDLGLVLNDAIAGVDCLQRSVEKRWRVAGFLADGAFVTSHFTAMAPLLLQIMHVRGGLCPPPPLCLLNPEQPACRAQPPAAPHAAVWMGVAVVVVMLCPLGWRR